jgi:hypothetical protein
MKQLKSVALAGALALAGCSEGLAPAATESAPVTPGRPATQQTAAAVLAVLDQSGWSAMDFGALGATSEFQNDGEPTGASGFGASGLAAADVSVPEFWGRIRGEPVSKVRTVTEKGDTAWASIRVDYNGAFLVDLTPGDNRLDVTSKPLVESLLQQARFEKTVIGESGEARWALVGITPQQYVATDESHRTVKITKVTVSVNGVVKIDVTDPTAFVQVVHGTEKATVPAFEKGDVVKVVLKVANTTGTNNTPPTFAFLSSFHADPNGLGWRRMRMEDTGDGTFSLSWVVRQRGNERVIVEALDAQSFVTPTADDYCANIWGIPYSIR